MLSTEAYMYTSKLCGCFKEQKASGEFSVFLNTVPLSKCLPGETHRLCMTWETLKWL